MHEITRYPTNKISKYLDTRETYELIKNVFMYKPTSHLSVITRKEEIRNGESIGDEI